MTEALIRIFSAIAIAAVSSWITVQLSRNKFRSERWWEKKIDAYERVIEAFHNSKRFYTKHIDASEHGIEIGEEKEEELRKTAGKANDEISRTSDIGAFILSKKAVNILVRYEVELRKAEESKSWFEYLDTSWLITNKYMNEFIAEAQLDLKK